ncbi:DDB1- and CUL4-associated factor 13 [Physocladia obscura]|uniref:DDB1- and CUL4-associated factor 13 n=1 Tax=Physocladia obscura TaxID=109957 RepID=A0AAD5T1R5_9FUNG|nr:DDB1- and CUL4-associated factor 13 [Physocladia obscura]
MLAEISTMDSPSSSRVWGRLAGLEARQLTALKTGVLVHLDYAIHVSAAEFAYWCQIVQRWMKLIKTISRSDDDHVRASRTEVQRLARNVDPALHPFEKAREYTRALNAAKLDRLFAKPFVGALTGHRDGVYCMAKHPTALTRIASGSADGEIRVWSLQSQQTVWSAAAHRQFVRGISFVPYSAASFVSVGADKTVKLWDAAESHASPEPRQTFLFSAAFTGVSHHRADPVFATSSTQIDIWDHSSSQPIQSMQWGAETVTTVRFNQTERSILASAGSDRTVILYDIRSNSPIAKNVMALATNAISWNPMEAFNFTCANEDHNLYTFDMRKLNSAINILKGHVSAVLDVDYSPTGQQLVSGSYDKTIRIFNSREGHSRDTYFTKRMQRLFCVQFSMDDKYVISGSDDGNLRLWKANASEKMGALAPRQQAALNYNKALKERYKHMPEIKRIDNQRHLPKMITKTTQKIHTMTQSVKRKEANVRKHSKPESFSKNFLSYDKSVPSLKAEKKHEADI